MTISVNNKKELFSSLRKNNKDVTGLRVKDGIIEVFVKINSKNSSDLPNTVLINNETFNVKISELDFKLTSTGCGSLQNFNEFSILSGGCSIESWSPNGLAPKMTLTGVFKDSLDGNLVGLTVSHGLRKYDTFIVDAIDTTTLEQRLVPVVLGEPFIPFFFVEIYAMEQLVVTDSFEGYTVNRKQKIEEYDVRSIDIYHAPYPGMVNNPSCHVGSVKRANALAPFADEMQSLYINKLDVCVIDLNGNRIDKTSKNTAFMPTSIRPNTIQFMTKEELKELADFMSDGTNAADERYNVNRVFFSGSFTGPQGRDTTPCYYKVGDFFDFLVNPRTVNKPVPYEDPFSMYTYVYGNIGWFFRDLAEEAQSNRTQLPIVNDGDSGAILWLKPLNTDVWKMAGIIIGSVVTEVDPRFSVTLADGGKQTIQYGAAYIPMYYLADKFKIEPWNDDDVKINTEKSQEVILDESIPYERYIQDFENFTAYGENVESLDIQGLLGFYSGPARVDYRNSINYKYT